MATSREKPKADDNPAGSLSNDEVTEKCGKLILVLKWSGSAKKDPNDLEKSLKSWSKKECKGLTISVVKILDDNNAVIKTEPYEAANIVQKLSGKELNLKWRKTVTVESVVLDSPKLDTQTADEASMSYIPSTSDDKGQMNDQSDQDSIPEESSRDEKKNLKDGGVPDKHTLSSKSNTSDQTSQRDKVDPEATTSSDSQEEEKSKADDSAADSVSKAELPLSSKSNTSDQTSQREKVDHKDATSSDIQEGSAEKMQKNSEKHKAGNPADSLSEAERLDKGQINGQSDQHSIPEQRSRDGKKDSKDGGVPDKHTLSSKRNTSDQTSQREKVDHKDATSSDIQEGSAEKMQKNSEKHKADSNPAGSLSEAERLDKGQIKGQSDQHSIPEERSRDGKKDSKDGGVPDKHTLSSKSNTSVQTSQRDKVKRGAAASLDFSKAAKIVEKLPGTELKLKWRKTVTVESAIVLDSPKLDTQTADEALMSYIPSTSDDKGQMNSQSDQDSILKQSSRDGKKDSKDGGVPDKHTLSSKSNTSDQTSQRDKVKRGAAASLDFSKDEKILKNRHDKESKADDSAADSVSKAELLEKDEALITLVLKWSKQTKKQQKLLETSLQSWFNERKTGLSCSVVKILEEKNAVINVKPSSALEILQILSGVNLTLQNGTTVTVESVILGSSKLKPQADEASMTPTPSKSDGKGIRQNQEEAVPVPVGFFWYLSQVYKEEIKRIEKENGCEMEVNLNVTFKAKRKDGSQQKALSEFTNLIQNHFNESRESVIPVQNVRPEQCSEAFKLIQKNENKVLLTLTPKEITVCGPDSVQLKSVLERNAPDEKSYLLHDDTPLKMTIKDPLADAGMKMEERTWKALDVDGKITKIKEKFDVDFQEVRRDGGKVQVKASYKGPEGNPFMESNAVRALLCLYQKSVTSPLNFMQLQGASGFMDWTKMHEDESEKRPVSEGRATGGDSAQLKSVLERNAPDEKPYLLHDDTPLKMTIKDPLADEGMKIEERNWKALKNDGTITKIKEKFEAEFDVKFQEVRKDGVRVQVKASYKGPEGNPFMDSNAVSALFSLYQKSVTSPLNFMQLQGASSFMDWTKMHEDESGKRPVSEGGAAGGDSTEDNCPICLSPFRDKKSLNCKHEFCKRCLQKAEENYGAICPICRKVFGIIQGDQPDGSMSWFRSSGQVPGFSNCGTITITYSIPDGTQTEKHPKPGQWYTGTTRTAYLPDNKEGNEVLKLLKKAFDQKLIFTIGASNTTGFKTQVTWNGIHHKTSLYGGPDSNGYPDPTYLSRVREELKAKGIE